MGRKDTAKEALNETPQVQEVQERPVSLEEWARSAGLGYAALAAMRTRYGAEDRAPASLWMQRYQRMVMEVVRG